VLSRASYDVGLRFALAHRLFACVRPFGVNARLLQRVRLESEDQPGEIAWGTTSTQQKDIVSLVGVKRAGLRGVES